MIGTFVNGCGRAHKCCAQHDELFNCRMKGTFNVLVKTAPFLGATPSFSTDTLEYYFVRVNEFFAWAVRLKHSTQSVNILELLTKDLLPDRLREEELDIEFLAPWTREQMDEWIPEQHWFQGFKFLRNKRSDSQMVLDQILKDDLREKTVLDIGCHAGFYALNMSEAGAKVVGFEPNAVARHRAATIRDKIIQQDVTFVRKDPMTTNDITLYLSVHHQPDPSYKSLKAKLAHLIRRTREVLFVELIVPPLFPRGSHLDEAAIDEIVGGEILLRYTHQVRGTRKLYRVEIADAV